MDALTTGLARLACAGKPSRPDTAYHQRLNIAVHRMLAISFLAGMLLVVVPGTAWVLSGHGNTIEVTATVTDNSRDLNRTPAAPVTYTWDAGTRRGFAEGAHLTGDRITIQVDPATGQIVNPRHTGTDLIGIAATSLLGGLLTFLLSAGTGIINSAEAEAGDLLRNRPFGPRYQEV